MVAVAKILAHGVACPLGLRSGPALAAIRAGFKVFEESELVFDRAGDGAPFSGLNLLSAETPRGDRMLELSALAAAEACEALSQAGPQSLPCFIALPGEGTIDVPALEGALGPRARELNPALELDIRPSRIFRGGRAIVFEALNAAIEAFTRGESWFALVGGVDSLVDPSTLRAMVAKDLVLSASNRGGLIPGEGAAFLLLAHPRLNEQGVVIGTIESCARGYRSADELAGDSLAHVFAALRRGWTTRVDRVVSGQTGQARFEHNLACAYLRNDTLMPEPMQALTLGAALGDTGAAAGALALALASAGTRPSRYNPGDRTVLAYAESEERCGACIISRYT